VDIGLDGIGIDSNRVNRGKEKLVQEEMPRGMEMNALWLLLDLRIDLLLVHSSTNASTPAGSAGISSAPMVYSVFFSSSGHGSWSYGRSVGIDAPVYAASLAGALPAFPSTAFAIDRLIGLRETA